MVMLQANHGLQMVRAAKLVGLIILALLLVCLLIAMYQTYQVEHRPQQAAFRGGKLPTTLPNGFYKGEVPAGLRHGWQGKVFSAAAGTGINQFEHDQRFIFKIYPAPGLRDKHMQVLRIDYRQPGNPWWLHFITDEIVQTGPGHFLGKVHLRVMPGLTFSLTYFELAQASGG